MKNRTYLSTLFMNSGLLAAVTFVCIQQKTLAAEPPVDPAHAAHVASGAMPSGSAKADPALLLKISQLETKVSQLKVAIAKNTKMPPMTPSAAMPGMSGAPMSPATPPMSMGMDKMKSGGSMGMMGMMDKMMGMMDQMMPMGGGAMPAAAAPMNGSMGMMEMEDKMEMVGMMGMGAMGKGSMDAMPQSALPGFPGASHLYHIGATGFFLDHPEHIMLTAEQQTGLNKAKEQALLSKSTADRGIEQAEQELWTLTAADQPDAGKIKSKLSEIGKLMGDERFTFIRAVGDASKLLTDEQRKILTGFAPPSPANSMTTPAMAPMKDM